MQRQRDGFVDIIKIYACILVVMGHFFQSMTVSGIIPQNSFLLWFDKTIYYFHVPLFFICSGYLYQKYSSVVKLKSWTGNILKKGLSLLIPYFIFSAFTWVLKTLLSSSVNTKVDNFFISMFLKPISPYWYLYALFFIFLITPTFKTKKIATLFLVFALGILLLSFAPFTMDIYALTIVVQNLIWFVLGMCFSCFKIDIAVVNTLSRVLAVALSVVFVVLSIPLFCLDVKNSYVSFVMGLIACVATVIIAINCQNCLIVNSINAMFSKYTMPVFLMHTIFAAGLRSVFLKLGITNSVVHIVLGLLISFIGPVVAVEIMSRIKGLDFVLYPTKYIKIKPRSANNG